MKITITRLQLISLCLTLLVSLVSYKGNCQQHSVTTTASTIQFWGASGGFIVWGFKNNNVTPIKIKTLSNHLPALSASGTYTLWYHPTAISGAPSAVSTANGWIQIAVSQTITYPTVAGIMPIFTGLNFEMPANTIYRFALQSNSAQGPYYGNGGASADSFDYPVPGVRIYLQNSTVSPGYAGPPTGAPTGTPRGFLGTIGFDKAASGSNNASVQSLISPKHFCVGNHDVKVKVFNSGNNRINNVTVKWTLDGVVQAPYMLLASLDTVGGTTHPNDTIITLGNVSFNGPRVIKIWTDHPNNVVDTVNVDDTINVTVTPSLNGTYTIGGSTPHYTTVAAAVTALNTAGVCGPVTFNVDSASGPYNAGLSFGNIIGASATNTITFNGNGAIVTGTVSPLMSFTTSSYIKIKRLNIIGGSGYAGVGVVLTNQCHHLTFDSNTINVGVTSTATSNIGFMSSASLTAVNTLGNNAQYVTFTNNDVIGGYYNFALAGTANYLNNHGHYIANNRFRDFYAYGAYLYNADTVTFINNDINRLGRVSAGTTVYGIYLSIARNLKIRKNRIYAFGTGSYIAYPMYLDYCINSSGYETEVTNNAIYNIPTTGNL